MAPTGIASFSSCESLSLHHNSLVTDVDEHFEFNNKCFLLFQLGIKRVNFFLLFLFHLLHVLAGFGQLPPQISTDAVFRRLSCLGVYSWPVFGNSSSDFCRVTINGGSGIVNVPR